MQQVQIIVGEYFGVMSNEEHIEYPKYLISNMDKLKLLGQELPKCTPYSNNWYK